MPDWAPQMLCFSWLPSFPSLHPPSPGSALTPLWQSLRTDPMLAEMAPLCPDGNNGGWRYFEVGCEDDEETSNFSLVWEVLAKIFRYGTNSQIIFYFWRNDREASPNPIGAAAMAVEVALAGRLFPAPCRYGMSAYIIAYFKRGEAPKTRADIREECIKCIRKVLGRRTPINVIDDKIISKISYVGRVAFACQMLYDLVPWLRALPEIEEVIEENETCVGAWKDPFPL